MTILHGLLSLVLLLVAGGACNARLIAVETTTEVVTCPQCAGAGTIACTAHCKAGKLRCPATCLKKDDPGWVPGPEGKTVQNFPSHKAGMTGNAWFSTGHIGELIVYVDGLAVDKGKCPTCNGTSFVECKACKGIGSLACPLCQGAKTVPKQEADAFQAKAAAELKKNAITTTDGRTFQGKVIARTADKVFIKTSDGKTVVLDAALVVDNSEKK